VPRFQYEDWELLQAICDAFSPTIIAIKALESEKYPTQSMILTLITLLEQEVGLVKEKGKLTLLKLMSSNF